MVFIVFLIFAALTLVTLTVSVIKKSNQIHAELDFLERRSQDVQSIVEHTQYLSMLDKINCFTPFHFIKLYRILHTLEKQNNVVYRLK